MSGTPKADATPVRKPPAWLLWGALVLIILAQTQAALYKHPRYGPFVSGADLFAALLFGIWAVWALFTGAWRRVWLPPIAAWAFIGVAVIAAGRADSPEALRSGVVEVAQYTLYFLCVYTLFLNALQSEAAVKKAIGLLCILTALMVLVALVQYAVIADPADHVSFREVNSTFGVGQSIAETAIGQKLHIAGQSSRSVYCSFMLMVLPILFSLGLSLQSPKWLKPALLVTVALGAVTVLSGWHFWCLVAVLLALALRHGAKTAAMVALATVAFVAVSPVVLTRNYQANVVEVMDFYETGVLDQDAISEEDYSGDAMTGTEVKKRWIEWQPAIAMLGQSPALGVGTGGYQLHIGQNYGMLPNFKKIEPDTNCGWLVIAGSMGLCGFIALVALYFTRYRAAIAASTSGASEYLRALGAGLAGSVLGLFLANIFSGTLVRGLSITVILVLALATVLERLPKADDEAEETEDETVEPTLTEAEAEASEPPMEGD